MTPRLGYIPHNIFLSDNSKTGYSINVSIARTCQPTRACQSYCYGLESRIALPASLNRHAENAARFDFLEDAPEAVVQEEARIIAARVLKKQSFLRVFGVGDLQPGSVRFINTLAAIAPELTLWVATRKFELARGLEVRPNVHVMLGTDASMSPKRLEQSRALVQEKGPTFYIAYVQQFEDEKIPEDVSVAFAEHHWHGRAKWSEGEVAAQLCPATVVGGAAHDNACDKCRYCFSSGVRENNPEGPLTTTKLKVVR
jgi:hypothetical protein